jgi:hypothetical protein
LKTAFGFALVLGAALPANLVSAELPSVLEKSPASGPNPIAAIQPPNEKGTAV